MKKLITCLFLISSVFNLSAQERVVKVDFEAAAFTNNPHIPFDKPFMIEGEVYNDIEFVQVKIFHEGRDTPIHSFKWNRDDRNKSENFSVQIPGVLTSNSKYDFEVITYKLMTQAQKRSLKDNLEQRVAFYLYTNYVYDGKNVGINKPKVVYRELKTLINEALRNYISKNNIECEAPSQLVLQELENNRNYRFKTLFKKSKRNERDDIATDFIQEKVQHLTNLVMSEIIPYINSNLVQHHRSVRIPAVATDKEKFTLPINFGMYAWNKTATVNNASVKNTNFTPGVGFTIPFSGKSTLATKSRLFDSFGYSMGVLIEPIRDAGGTEFTTPGVNIPVYAGIGFRLFKVVRLNAAALIVGERGLQDFNNLTVVPTVGLALELNLWMGIKK